MLKRKRCSVSLPTITEKFELNEEIGGLVSVGIQDDFALVQSSKDTAFRRILEKLGYFDDNTPVELFDREKVLYVDDHEVAENLEDLGFTSYSDFVEKMQDYAEKRGLPSTYTIEQIVDDMRGRLLILKQN